MIKLLDSQWYFENNLDGKNYKANIPGQIHLDLLNNELIDEPFYGENESKLQWIGEKDWKYFTNFDVDENMLEFNNIEMIFEGLDTYATIILNNVEILKTDNMFRTWKLNCKEFLKRWDNELIIIFKNVFEESLPKLENDDYNKLSFYNNDQAEVKVGLYNRKAQFHFGWDWGPRFVTCGIWRPIKLNAYNNLKFESIYYIQEKVDEQNFKITARFEINSEIEQNVECTIEIEELNLLKNLHTKLNEGINFVEMDFSINNAKLWWTNGLGKQYLYEIRSKIESENELYEKVNKIGIRELEVVREKDSYGRSFYIKLNGVPIFMKGANYIPQDSFQGRVSKRNYRDLIDSSVESNFNMLRVWGGGIYEEDEFYDYCDEKGILVWQDFMFACAMYPANNKFLNSVRHEIIDNVKRIRNHTSLALYCGNNENEIGWHNWQWKEQFSPEDQEKYESDLKKLFYETIPHALKECDSERYYHPTSPSADFNGIEKEDGDTHYWEVWHGKKPFESFDDNVSRFVSEYGFQSHPDINSVSNYVDTKQMQTDSVVMQAHQRCMQDEGKDKLYGTRLIDYYMNLYFRKPKDFTSHLYVSQLLQAFGISMAINSHRENMPFCMGSLYWQLNDCWPVTSWSSIDYYGSWKALHYQVKRDYENLLPIVKLKGNHINISIVSDELKDLDVTLTVELKSFMGNIILSEQKELTIKKLKFQKYIEMEISNYLDKKFLSRHYLSVKIEQNNKSLAERLFFLCLPKNLDLQNPSYSLRLEGESLFIKSNVLAKSVFLRVPSFSGRVFRENYFDLEANIEKEIKILQQIENVNDIRLLSLFESYAKE